MATINKPIAVPLTKWALKFLADRGLGRWDTQLGLSLVPQDDVKSFNDQTTEFLEGYATCLSDLLHLVEEKQGGVGDLKTLGIIMRTWLYLCSNAVSNKLGKRYTM